MKALLQRVASASVHVEGRVHSSIGRGLLVFVGCEKGDTRGQAETLARKITRLRVFEDREEKMNLDLAQVGGECLVVSQFTLCADLSRGKRPSFDPAMRPPEAERLYEAFCGKLAAATRRPVRTGRFGAMMRVELENDGPATFLLYSRPDRR